MKVKDLIEELKSRNPDATVFILDEDGEHVPVNKLFRIDNRITPSHLQDVLLMEKF